MSLVELIDFSPLGDERGSLIALESNKSIPFNIKRVYYIFDTQKSVSRGFHAHKQLEQIAVCVTGSCRMILDNGKQRESIWLDSAKKGVWIKEMIWREMHDFSDDCVLLVLASEFYDESDYIRDYDEFLGVANGKL